MSPEILLPNCPFKFFLHLPLKYLSPITLRNWTGGGMDPGSTWDDSSSYSRQNLFGCIRQLHQILYDPPKFQIIELFSSYLGLLHHGVPREIQVQSRAALGFCSWAPIPIPTSLQPYKQRGEKKFRWIRRPTDGPNAVSITVPDWKSHVSPGSLGISRQLPPWAEVRMLINTQLKGSCWVVINICH